MTGSGLIAMPHRSQLTPLAARTAAQLRLDALDWLCHVVVVLEAILSGFWSPDPTLFAHLQRCLDRAAADFGEAARIEGIEGAA